MPEGVINISALKMPKITLDTGEVRKTTKNSVFEARGIDLHQENDRNVVFSVKSGL